MTERLTPLTHDSVPRTCGPYLLLGKLGSGGMAEVFRAVRTGPEGFMRTFALKRISPSYAASEEFVQMFCAEARVTALLHHPSLVQVHEFGSDGGAYYLVMEYLRGRTALELICELRDRHRFLSPAIAAYVARQVALGLAYAHGMRDEAGTSLGLVHRDVTPSNVMLLRSGAVKLLDFGIVKAPTLTSQKTQAGLMKGKFSYASPEQLRCQPLDGRSDVFSLGVVLWELLTLEKLFPGDTDYEVVQNAVKQTVVPPSRLRPDVSPVLDDIVLRALTRDRDKRPDAKELAAALGEYLRSEQFLEDALVDLMRDLWSTKSSQVVALPPSALHAMGAAAPPPAAVLEEIVTELSRTRGGTQVAQPLLPAPPEEKSATPAAFSPAPRPKRPLRARLAAPVGALAGLTLVVLVGIQTAGRVGDFLAPPQPPSSAVGVPEQIQLELDSKPSGARVRWGETLLGITPMTLRLPKGSKPIVLRIEHDDRPPLLYELVPERDAIATVQLLPAAPRR